jgi:hypothetical protein
MIESNLTRRGFIKGVTLLGASTLIGSNFLGCAERGENPVTVTVGTPPEGSGNYILASNIAEMVTKYLPKGSSVDVIPTGGTAAEIKALDEDKIDLASSGQQSTNYLAYNGMWPFEKAYTQLRAIAGKLSNLYFATAVLKKTGITSWEELIDEQYPIKFATFPKGSTGIISLQYLLKTMGLSIDDLLSWGGKWYPAKPSDITTLFADGKVEAFFHVIQKGHPLWTQLTSTYEFNYLPFPEKLESKIKEFRYDVGDIPASDEVWKNTLNGLDSDYHAILMYTEFFTTDKLPDNIAYTFAKAIAENREAILKAFPAFEVYSPEDTWKEKYVGEPLHPGAERYYKEAGYMK